MGSKNRWAVLAALTIVASMLLSACGAPATPEVVEKVVKETVIVAGTPQVVEKQVTTVVEKVVTATPAAGEGLPTMRINVDIFPETLDPQQLSWTHEIGHVQLMYEGLTRFDPSGKTVPAAAETFEPNEDATMWTFTLREGLTYSDGTPLNAMRYQHSILRNMDPTVAGEYAYLTDDIVGAYEYRTADLSALSEEEVAALRGAVGVHALDGQGNACTGYDQDDCRTLQIQVSRPAPYFPASMALWVTYPVREELLSEGGPDWYYGTKFQIGNGPFILKTLEPFVRALLVPNPSYWRGVPTYNIEYSYITDGSVAFEAYKNGEFDQIQIQAEDLPTIEADPVLNEQKHIVPAPVTYHVVFHNQREPFDDPKVRQAFAMAIDREAWIRDVMKGLGLPTLSWMPPGVPGYREGETRWGFDPEGAMQALTESSYGGPEGLPQITATFRDDPRIRVRWEWLAAQWKQYLGVDVVLDPVEPTTYTALIREIETHPHLALYGWGQDYPDPKSWLSDYWRTGTQCEDFGYSNPEFDALVDEADGELDAETRQSLYEEAEDLLIADAPSIFLYNRVYAYLVSPAIKGYVPSPLDYWFIGDNDPLTITVEAH